MKKYAIYENDENNTSSLIFTDNLQKDFFEFYQIEWNEKFEPGERIPFISNVRRSPGSYEYVVSVFSIDPETTKTKNLIECNFYTDSWQGEVHDFIIDHWNELSRQTLESIQNFDDETIETDEDDRILKFGEMKEKSFKKLQRTNNSTVSIDRWTTY